MFFLFAPALASVAVILVITLRELFTFREPVPMLDQIAGELTSRHVAGKRRRTLDAKRVLAVQANRALGVLIESSEPVAARGGASKQ